MQSKFKAEEMTWSHKWPWQRISKETQDSKTQNADEV